METHWEELLWNSPNTVTPYTSDDWQNIVDGLVESFNRFFRVGFVHAKPPRLNLENDEPCLGLELTCTFPTPFGPFQQLAKGGFTTYRTETGKQIDTNISVFLFLDQTRLRADPSGTGEQTDDCLLYVFVRQADGSSAWECRGWEDGFPGEWDGLTFPENVAATNRLVMVK
jgi:hypothetical protein